MRRIAIYEDRKGELVIEADAKGWPWRHMRPGQYFEYPWTEHSKVRKGAYAQSQNGQYKFVAIGFLGRCYGVRKPE